MSTEQWPTLTEATVRELARSKSYDRGQSYYERGAVSNVVRRGETARADVEGSQYQPYTVTLKFDDAGVAQTDCSCPYDHGGICKHRVAVLLTCLRDPESVRDEPPISELVADADLEPEVKTTLESLEERGLIERVGERKRLGPPLGPGDDGTTGLWEPTVEGRAEASAIREAYSTEVEALAESHGTESDEFKEQIVTLARMYGILPNYFG